ncbi:MAG TPA: hypothetical protein VI298_00885 [Geobacteraceae bacterium]
MKKRNKHFSQVIAERMDKKNKDPKQTIISALSDPKWEYRTARGIAKDTRMPEKEIENTLEKLQPLIRVSVTKTKEGENLYALKERKSLLGDYWSAFKSMNIDKFGGGK